MSWLAEFFVVALFISLLLCFSVTVFVSVNVFSFQRVVNFKHLFIDNKKKQGNPVVVGGGYNEPVLYYQYGSYIV